MIQGSAEFSDCGFYRHRLDRWWGEAPRALVIGANPSRAGADDNDPTICRLIALLSWRTDIGGFTMMNADDFIATDPADHVRWRDGLDITALKFVRGQNLQRIRDVSTTAAVRIVAFGNLLTPGLHRDRVLAALSLDGRHPLFAFGLTDSGAPKHPLARGHHRIPNDAPLIEWRPALRSAA
ncbi:DUF1643 domain-containing protein [Methylobacterium haplocladii]|uniref:DUF1643 domain-containing protein n=1 Tax=Methylobacterium haplocladii TaxID=1176176 RepID=UPI0011BDC2AA|nr:DUF1643 domain-containing protein [Methylobacterium haplocladii]